MSISRLALIVALVLCAAPSLAADRSAVVPAVPGQAYYVQLAPMFIPVIEKNSVSRQVSIALAVQIADGADAKDVTEKRPELDSAFLSDIYAYVQQRSGIGVPNGQVALKARLLATAQRILDPIKVNEIEIEAFFEQRR